MVIPETTHEALSDPDKWPPWSAQSPGNRTLMAPRSPRRASRNGAQAIVEFGLVVLLFVLLISGMFDFGISLNARLSISSLSRVLARAAAEGATKAELTALADGQGHIIGVTTDTYTPYVGFSDTDPSAAILVTRTYCQATPTASCTPPSGTPQPGDRVEILVVAQGLEVFTPLVRPVFGCNTSQAHCFERISAQTTMRVEPTPGP